MDARYPERWLSDRRILRLSDAAHRLFVLGMVWSTSNRSDGDLPADDLVLIPSVDPSRATELVSAGLWEQTPSGYQVVSFGSSQSTAAQLEALDRKRVMDRDRQARHRAGRSGSAAGVTRDIPRDDRSDGTRDAKARPGQARTGQASTGEPENYSSDDDPWAQADDDRQVVADFRAGRRPSNWPPALPHPSERSEELRAAGYDD